MTAPELPRELSRYGQERTIRAGRAFQYQDDPCLEAFYLLEGVVRPVKFATDGKSFDLLPVTAGAWIGLAELLARLPCLYDAVAVDECRVLSFSAMHLEHAVQDSIASRAVIAALSGEIIRTHRFLADEDAQGKILSFLLSKRFLPGSSAERQCIRLTQNALADFVGLTRETVNRQLKELEAMALVSMARCEIGIPDWERLVAFMNERRK